MGSGTAAWIVFSGFMFLIGVCWEGTRSEERLRRLSARMSQSNKEPSYLPQEPTETLPSLIIRDYADAYRK